jgi:hypothetical protein
LVKYILLYHDNPEVNFTLNLEKYGLWEIYTAWNLLGFAEGYRDHDQVCLAIFCGHIDGELFKAVNIGTIQPEKMAAVIIVASLQILNYERTLGRTSPYIFQKSVVIESVSYYGALCS